MQPAVDFGPVLLEGSADGGLSRCPIGIGGSRTNVRLLFQALLEFRIGAANVAVKRVPALGLILEKVVYCGRPAFTCARRSSILRRALACHQQQSGESYSDNPATQLKRGVFHTDRNAVLVTKSRRIPEIVLLW